VQTVTRQNDTHCAARSAADHKPVATRPSAHASSIHTSTWTSRAGRAVNAIATPLSGRENLPVPKECQNRHLVVGFSGRLHSGRGAPTNARRGPPRLPSRVPGLSQYGLARSTKRSTNWRHAIPGIVGHLLNDGRHRSNRTQVGRLGSICWSQVSLKALQSAARGIRICFPIRVTARRHDPDLIATYRVDRDPRQGSRLPRRR
jgi:hypothetical protein